MGFKKSTAVISMALLVGALPCHAVFAQSSEMKAARQSVERSLDKAAQQKAVTPAETAEVRQAAIVSIVDLTKTEVQETAEKLSKITEQADAGLAGAASEVRESLIMHEAYVDLVRGQVVREADSLESLKLIAAGLKDWREKVYDPSMRQAFNVLLVAQGGSVIETATHRLEKVSEDLKKLQIARSQLAASLLPLFESARGHIGSAMKYRDQARDALMSEQEKFEEARFMDNGIGPRETALRRGDVGDFVCAPGNLPVKGTACPIAFKRSLGGYYLLKQMDGQQFSYAVSDLAQVKGVLVTVTPLFSEDTVAGLFFVQSVNRAEGAAPIELNSSENANFTASIADAVIGSPKIQSLVKKAIDEIGLAYKDFFAMIKKVQQAK